VSAPLTWDEVLSAQLTAADFTANVVLDRIDKHGDLLGALCEPGPEVPS